MIAGADVTRTTGTLPAASLVVTRLPVPVWAPSVCEAFTVTGPSGKALTSTARLVHRPALHCAEAGTVPISTATASPVAEQVPETV